MSDSIVVAIKVRPLIKREEEKNLQSQWLVKKNWIAPMDPESKKRTDGFQFDHVFDVNSTNTMIFETVVEPIVDGVVTGFNGTIIAYGQTSSGKTHTMLGSETENGIIQLAVQHIFNSIEETDGRDFLLRVSYLEVYNERINDLLNPNSTDLKLHDENKDGSKVFVKCKEEITNSPENIIAIMKRGEKNRRTGETNMNERSSRSHTILRITIESRESNDEEGAVQVGQLNLVDLAGSERVHQTGATGERFKEGRHINTSLLTLGSVIKQLSEMPQDAQKFVNFRDSKLTRLLQASLGGNARTVIICAVTPASLEETQSTLRFASRAKSIQNKPCLNECISDTALLKRYTKQLAKLEAELQRYREDCKPGDQREDWETMATQLIEKDRANQLLKDRIELLKTHIMSGKNCQKTEGLRFSALRRQTWGGNERLKNFRESCLKKNDFAPKILDFSNKSLHKKRRSLVECIDITNRSCETMLEDFELQMMETEQFSPVEEEPELKVAKHRVQFSDDISYSEAIDADDADATLERLDKCSQTGRKYDGSPGTPKERLRQQIYDLEEKCSVQEFTITEMQVNYEDSTIENNFMAENKKLKEELQATSLELNDIKLDIAELQKTIYELTNEALNSNQTIEKLRKENELLIGENNELSTSVMDKIEENETLSREIENLKKRYTNRESIKLESKQLNLKLNSMKAKLEREIKDVESLRNEDNNKQKVIMDLNLSPPCDKCKSFEERVVVLRSDFANLRQEIEKCSLDIANESMNQDKLSEIHDRWFGFVEEIKLDEKLCLPEGFDSLKNYIKSLESEKDRLKSGYAEEFVIAKNYIQGRISLLLEESDDKGGDLGENPSIKQLLDKWMRMFARRVSKERKEKLQNRMEALVVDNEQLKNYSCELKNAKSYICNEIRRLSNENNLEEELSIQELLNELVRIFRTKDTAPGGKDESLISLIKFENSDSTLLENPVEVGEEFILNSSRRSNKFPLSPIVEESAENEQSNVLQEDLKKSKEENTRLLEKIILLESDNQRLQSDYYTELTHAIAYLDDEIKLSVGENPSIKQVLDELMGTTAQRYLEMKKENEILQEKITLLTYVDNETKEENLSINQVLDKLKTKIEEQNLELKKESEKITLLESDNQRLKNEYFGELSHALTYVDDEIKLLIGENPSIKQVLDGLMITTAQKYLEMKNQNVILQEKITLLENDNQRLNALTYVDDETKEENSSIKQVLDKLKTEIEEQNLELKKASEKIILLESDNQRLRSDYYTELTHAMTYVDDEIQSLVGENPSIKQVLDGLMTSNAKKYLEIKNENTILQEKINFLENDNQRLNSLTYVDDETKEENPSINQVLDKLKTKIEEQNLELKKESEKITLLESDNQRLKNEYYTELTHAKAYLDDEIKSSVGENPSIKQVLDELMGTTAQRYLEMEKENEVLQEKITLLTYVDDETKEENPSIKQVLDKLKTKIKEQDLELKKESEKIILLESDNQRLQSDYYTELTHAMTYVDDEIKLLVGENPSIKQVLDGLMTYNAKKYLEIKNENTILQEKVTLLEFDNQRLKSVYFGELTHALTYVDDEMKFTLSDNPSIKEVLDELMITTAQKYFEMKKEVERLQETDNEKLKNRQELKQAKEYINNKTKSLIHGNDIFNEIDENQSIIHLLEIFIRINAEKISDIEKKMVEMKEELKKENDELKVKCAILAREMKDQVHSEKFKEENDKLKSMESHLILRVEEKETRIQHLNNEMFNLQQQLEQTNQQIIELNLKYDEKCKQNNELDKELDEYAEVIKNKIHENAVLEDKYYQTDNDLTSIQKQSKILENTILSKNEIISNSQIRVRELERMIENLEDKILTIKCKCSNPVYEKRRQSRNESFDRQRSLELDDEESILKKKIHELELVLVTKNAEIVTLELQIQSQSFPFKNKYEDLERHVKGLKRMNSELKRELDKRVNPEIQECEKCKKRKENCRDQTTQCLPEMIRFSGQLSGVIEEHQILVKLEKEKYLLMETCKRRLREYKDKINDLQISLKGAETRCKELETTITKMNTFSGIPPRQAMKENIPPSK